MGAKTHHDHQERRAGVVFQGVRNGCGQVEIVFPPERNNFVAVGHRPLSIEDYIHLIFARILNGGAGPMRIEDGLAVPRYADNHRGIRVSLAEQRLVVAARRREIGPGFFHCRGIAIKKGRVDFALVPMEQRYTKDSGEQSRKTLAGHGIGQSSQSFALVVSGWPGGKGTDATRGLGGVPAATEATETASSPKKFILIFVSNSTGFPST